MANVCRGCAVIIAISFTAMAAHAQFINGGFETAGTNFIFPADLDGTIITNIFAAGWIPNGGAFVSRDLTNIPATANYRDVSSALFFNGVNSTGVTNTAHTGGAALRTFGPFGTDFVGSGASQVITNSISQVVSNGQVWAVSGFALNWSGDPLTNTFNGGGFGTIQIAFLDITNSIIAFTDGQHFDTNTAVDTWISCTATGTAPPGTVGVAAFCLHVGKDGGLGSCFFDDVTLTFVGIAPPPPIIVTNNFQASIQKGNQVCWATVVNTSYQPQSSDDNSTWTDVGTPIPGDGSSNCVFATNHKFYRVVQSQGGASVLTNPGFETGTASNGDSNAAGWTAFASGFRTSTNIPTGSPGGSGFGISAHSGAFSMKTFGPFSNGVFDASGAYQNFSTATAGSQWRFAGYVLNGANDQLAGPDGFGVAQLIFLDTTGGTGNVLQVTSSPHVGVDVSAPLNTWQKFEVDATAPANVQTVRAQVAHVGHDTDTGSMWWDDVTLYQVTSSNVNSVVTQAAVQVSWPTSTPTNAVRYQIQSTPSLIFTNTPAINVLTNAGFEANAVSNAADTGTVGGWNLANGGTKATSSAPKPTHSGLGALRMSDTSTAVPVAWQGSPTSINIIPATPGQVWDLTGFIYVSSTDQPLNPLCNNGALVKIVWNDSAGVKVDPSTSDTNLIGTAATGQNGGIESAHVTGGSPQGSWIMVEARGTAPANTAYAQAFCILVGNGGGGAVRFDDIVFTTGGTHNGWNNLGPIYPGTGNPNTIFDTMTGTSKFYRVTTP